MPHGTHDYAPDPRNDEILIWVNGRLRPRAEAVVSVFDSGFVLGDGIWEGLRVYAGHPVFLEQHLDRLYEGAQALMLDIGMTRAELTRALYDTLAANGMRDGVHIRLMVTRGVKHTPYQDPRLTVGPATVVIIAEHKDPLPATVTDGITLFTTHVRRATPDTLDPKLNAHSKLNDVTACIQAYTAGADEALMLDPHGFVATCNSTHFFVVKGTPDEPQVWTSDGRFCLAGITRSNVLRLCRDNGLPAHERTFSLTDVYSAQEAFVTGTFAGVVPVRTVDGRVIGSGSRGPVVERLQGLYAELAARDAAGRAARAAPGGPGRHSVTEPVRVAMWSGPRNISTAMMRAWENRADTVVVDEPFYAAYLARTGIHHPAREEVIASQPTDPDAVVAGLLAPLPPGRTVHYAKHMTHHHDPADADLSWAVSFRNVLLIREPSEVVASYVRSREACEPEDIGLFQQAAIRDHLVAAGQDPPVIDAGDFLRDPEGHLRWLCAWLGIEFTGRMLAWPAGPRDSDGVWAPHWYDAVWRSTGFEPWRPRDVELNAHDAAVAAACLPAYESLAAHRVRL